MQHQPRVPHASQSSKLDVDVGGHALRASFPAGKSHRRRAQPFAQLVLAEFQSIAKVRDLLRPLWEGCSFPFGPQSLPEHWNLFSEQRFLLGCVCILNLFWWRDYWFS